MAGKMYKYDELALELGTGIDTFNPFMFSSTIKSTYPIYPRCGSDYP